ncbi:hypothetical protein ABW19_dt0208042 [Dactylella cylindrospora]|nr:hypothetical protein ABW19_dt0208042 [Dactylella cylindrospora]
MTKSLDQLLQADRRKRAKATGKGKETLAKIPTGPKGGVQKRKAAPQPPSSLNGKWTHDLHATVADATKLKSSNGNNGAKAPVVLNKKLIDKLSSNRLFEALHGSGTDNTAKQKVADLGISIRGASKPSTGGITIKGSAGPFAVHGSNFAPGTTASDIRNVMEGRGYAVINCGILSANPTVIAEIVFEKRDEAQRCVEEFNNRLADGRLLHFMLKDSPQLPIPPKARGAAQTAAAKPVAKPAAKPIPTGPARLQQNQGNVVDGKYGFSTRGGLYSDRLLKGRETRR